MWPTDTAPAGWLLCDGTDHSRTGTGAALFAVIGTTFGVGNGSTTFDVPDMRGRFALGQDDMGGLSANRVTDTRADTIGSGSGSQTHTQSLAELVAHTHTGVFGSADTDADLIADGSSAAGAWTSDSTGGGQPMNILNPYLTVNYIIRAR